MHRILINNRGNPARTRLQTENGILRMRGLARYYWSSQFVIKILRSFCHFQCCISVYRETELSLVEITTSGRLSNPFYNEKLEVDKK